MEKGRLGGGGGGGVVGRGSEVGILRGCLMGGPRGKWGLCQGSLQRQDNGSP